MNVNLSVPMMLLLFAGAATSCRWTAPTREPSVYEPCDAPDPDAVVQMQGTIGIASGGDYIFKGVDHKGAGTYLIPCSDDLATYIESAYDSSLHLRRPPDPRTGESQGFWLTVEGVYISGAVEDEVKKTQFLVNWVALGRPEG